MGKRRAEAGDWSAGRLSEWTGGTCISTWIYTWDSRIQGLLFRFGAVCSSPVELGHVHKYQSNENVSFETTTILEP